MESSRSRRGILGSGVTDLGREGELYHASVLCIMYMCYRGIFITLTVLSRTSSEPLRMLEFLIFFAKINTPLLVHKTTKALGYKK